MRRRITARLTAAAVAAAVLGTPLGAQEADDPLSSIRTPSLPAFAILGIEPTAVERPTTPTAFTTGLLSATDEGTVLPDNYAVEVAPYWLTSHPNLLFRDRYAPRFLQLLKQSFALSVATSKPEGGDASTTRIGVGARLLLSGGRPGPDARFTEDSIRALQLQGARLSRRIDDATGEALDSLEAVRDSVTELRTRLNQDFMKLQQNPSAGLRWELALGLASRFPENSLNGADVTDWGAWTTVAFRPTATDFDLLLLGRYLRKDTPETGPGVDPGGPLAAVEGQNVVDLGGRVVGLFDRLSVSAEVLGRLAFDLDGGDPADGPGRTVIEHDSSVRATGTLRYRVSDDMGLSWTFGKDFRAPGSDTDPLIALLGLDLTLGNRLDLPFGAETR